VLPSGIARVQLFAKRDWYVEEHSKRMAAEKEDFKGTPGPANWGLPFLCVKVGAWNATAQG
jgi:hypothetical protein